MINIMDIIYSFKQNLFEIKKKIVNKAMFMIFFMPKL